MKFTFDNIPPDFIKKLTQMNHPDAKKPFTTGETHHDIRHAFKVKADEMPDLLRLAVAKEGDLKEFIDMAEFYEWLLPYWLRPEMPKHILFGWQDDDFIQDQYTMLLKYEKKDLPPPQQTTTITITFK